jgi:hypothetical protein
MKPPTYSPGPVARPPIAAERVRRINGQSFCFIPHRFLRDGFFASLTREELSFYLLLVLVGDRNGMSFYHYDRLCSMLEMDLDTYLKTRNRLIDKDLLAFDGSRFQILSLPDRPVVSAKPPPMTADDMEAHDPATIRSLITHALSDENGNPHDR